ncbi:Gfo/Idh/MocA family oxidoreductase [Saxibacter everestensis]|uniref:Gfo/Idh/MocA family oxidoreductase n=1 Tax=Saxibacter everestensis TaxID=2909229 RepID=A0ABY8QQ90_9MICO|nr:Gfo/Idh/MocA family oxidoreductase [Brevibacteriaceae bacterium ZFBP1038]
MDTTITQVGGRFTVRPEHIDPLTPTGDPLGWGVVATGNIARTVSKDLALLPDARLVGVSSRSQQRADAFASEFGFDRGYHGHQALLADPEIQVVYIAAPHGQHFEIAKAALAAGKHVLCEKAITIDSAELDQLVDLAEKSRRFLMEALWSRFVPGMQRALQIVHSGELGDPRWISANLGFAAREDREGDSRLWDPAQGGGALLDLGIYTAMWPVSIFGAPDSVHAVGQLTRRDVDTQTSMTFSYPQGYAQLSCSFAANGPGSVTIGCDRGFLQVPERQNCPRELHITDQDRNTRIERFEPVGVGYVYELREVTDCVRAGKTQSDLMPLAESQLYARIFDDVRKQVGIKYPPVEAR